MNELLLSHISKLSNTHFVSFGCIKIMIVNEAQVLDEDLESVLLLNEIVFTIELYLKLFKLTFEGFKFFRDDVSCRREIE